MIVALTIMLVVLGGSGIVLVAHELGRRAGTRKTIPWRPIFQLVEHRTRCLAQDRARVQRDLGPLLGIPDWAWSELFALRRPLERCRQGRGEP